VIAAGNAGPKRATVGCPGSAPDALTVGSFSILDEGKVASFSSRGPAPWAGIKPDCVAPGGGRALSSSKPSEYIYSGTSPGALLDAINDKIQNGYTPIAGTSMATPHVAGLMALWLQKGKVQTSMDVKKILKGKGVPKDNNKGYGTIYYELV
jgi:subtilisin family serine protease